jgi:hypothetical protein
LVAGVTAAARGKAVRCGFGAKAAARRDATPQPEDIEADQQFPGIQ